MRLGHEGMKVCALLPARCRHRKEPVHQHRLAAADVAMDVGALDGSRCLAGKEPAERASLGSQAALGEALVQPVEPGDRIDLAGIADDVAGRDLSRVMRGEAALTDL